ncbi:MULTISPECIES: DUF1330 domain-containing protein [unclassified Streptomyces]|uniref:DUF1330 domain-containing protein n=1 Tax=unclassified Streptomyces TaxID=2593676 RepID=UPI00380C9CB4
MPAYVIGNITTLETGDELAEYRRRVGGTIEMYGGRLVIRGGNVDVFEGDWLPVHLTLMEFPDGASAREWFESPEYREIVELRRGGVQTQLVLLEPQRP